MKLRALTFLLVALAQISVPASLIWKRHHTLHEGRVWKFRTAPVDPEDPFRGRYVALRFAVEDFPQRPELAITSSDNVYVLLRNDAEGFAEIERVSEQPLAGDNVIRADAASYYDDKQHVTLPFDRYWLEETIAPAADRAYAENSRRGHVNAYVTVRVRNGDAALEELYFDGQPLRDYVRRAAAQQTVPNK